MRGPIVHSGSGANPPNADSSRPSLGGNGREAAAFFKGYVAAKRHRTPKWILRHLRTATLVLGGGAFNPMDIWAMQDAATDLWRAAVEAGETKATHGALPGNHKKRRKAKVRANGH